MPRKTLSSDLSIKRIPNQFKDLYDIEKEKIIARVNAVFEENKKEKSFDECTTTIIDTWIFEKALESFYSSYVDFVKNTLLKAKPLTFPQFKSGVKGAGPQGITNVWKRFLHIEAEGIYPGCFVIEKGSGKEFRVVGITTFMELQFEDYSTKPNPLKFQRKMK